MKKLMSVLAMAGLLLWAGCSGDDEPNGPGNGVPTVVANTSVDEPTLSSVHEAMWSSVEATQLNVSVGQVSKSTVGKPSGVSSAISVQAIMKSEMLYLRLVWSDNSNSILRDHWVMIDTNNYNFTRNIGFPTAEDQLFVMFDGAPEGGWDTWNWRSLTTGKAFLAEGYTYRNDSLVRDSGAQIAAYDNVRTYDPTRPQWAHEDLAQFTGDVLYLQESTTDYIPSSGWSIGHVIPGWVIDSSLTGWLDNHPESRWDIRAIDDYDAESNLYYVVLARKLNTGFPEDVNMQDTSSVTARIVILQNENELNPGSTNQGYTPDFKLVLE